MSNYIRLRDNATKAIRRNGMEYQLVRGGVELVKGREVVIPDNRHFVSGLKSDYKPEEINGSLVMTGDVRLILTAEFDIKVGDRMTVDGVDYRIFQTNPIKPADIVLFYKPQLRS